MNGDVAHSGNADFTLLNGILSNEYTTDIGTETINSFHQYNFNAYGAYNNNKIKLNYRQFDAGVISNSVRRPFYYNNTFTFTLPLILKGNYTFEYIPYDSTYNTVLSPSINYAKFSITLDMNSNTVSIPVNEYLYTKQSGDKGYLKIIGITKN